MSSGINAFLQIEKGDVVGYKHHDTINLKKGTTIIGRKLVEKSNKRRTFYINILDKYVSREHINIIYDTDTGCFIIKERDGGSKNGTFVNGKKLGRDLTLPINDGDSIELAKIGGSCRIIFIFKQNEDFMKTLSDAIAIEKIAVKALDIEIASRKVRVQGKEVKLRRKEFDLLAFLYQNKGKACSKNEIAQCVWAEEGGIVSQETIDTNIHRIREKIESDPSNPSYIVTLPRYGYRLDM
jgi:DNA-binding winged helix-turn-helix (wHTH) protein